MAFRKRLLLFFVLFSIVSVPYAEGRDKKLSVSFFIRTAPIDIPKKKIKAIIAGHHYFSTEQTMLNLTGFDMAKKILSTKPLIPIIFYI